MIARVFSHTYRVLLTLGLCGSVICLAHIGEAQDDGWQSLESFLSEAESQGDYNPDSLSPGDIIIVKVEKVENLSSNYTLSSNGMIDFPLIGPIAAEGLSPEDLAEQLIVLYEKDYLVNPKITVSIFAKRMSQTEDTPSLNEYAAPVLIDTSPVQIFQNTDPIPLSDALPVNGPVPTEPINSPAEPDFIIIDEVLSSPSPISAPMSAPISAPISESVEIPWQPETKEPSDEFTAYDNQMIISESVEALPAPLEGSIWSVEGSSSDFIHFLSEGDMAGALSCNSFFGSYEAGPSDIDIHALTMTAIPCADDSKPQEFSDFLKLAKSYDLSGQELLLYDDQNNIIFALQPK